MLKTVKYDIDDIRADISKCYLLKTCITLDCQKEGQAFPYFVSWLLLFFVFSWVILATVSNTAWKIYKIVKNLHLWAI